MCTMAFTGHPHGGHSRINFDFWIINYINAYGLPSDEKLKAARYKPIFYR